MLLIPLEKLYTNRDSVRKAREAFLIHGGNTLSEPAGLTEEMKCNPTSFFLISIILYFRFYFIIFFFSVFFTHHVALSGYFRFII